MFCDPNEQSITGLMQSWAALTYRPLLPGKLRKINALCAALGVQTAPAELGGIWVVPLLSWYHASWDREPDIAGARPVEKVCTALSLNALLSALVPPWGITGLKIGASPNLALAVHAGTCVVDDVFTLSYDGSAL